MTKYLPYLAIIFFAAMIITNGEIAARSVRESLNKVATNVIPSLFCYMVLSKLIVNMIGSRSAPGFLTPVLRMFGCSFADLVCIVTGCLCGFPAGAAAASEISASLGYDEKRSTRLAAASNNVSAGFMISYVGGRVFASNTVGVLIYICVLLSSLLIFTLFGRHKPDNNYNSIAKNNERTFTDSFCKAVRDSASASLTLSAYIVFFSVVSSYVSSVAAIPARASSIIHLLIELSGGIADFESSNIYVSTAIVAFAVSFSGVCVLMQSAEYLRRGGVRMTKYVLIKTLQGIICAVLSCAAVRLFCRDSAAFASDEETISSGLFYTFAAIVLILVFIAFEVKRFFEMERNS